MVPVWLLVPVLVLGVLVGAGLGWLMRQRTLASAAQPRHWGAEPASSPAVVTPEPPGDPNSAPVPLIIERPAPDTALKEPEPETAAPAAEHSEPSIRIPVPEPEPAPDPAIAEAAIPEVKAEPEPKPEPAIAEAAVPEVEAEPEPKPEPAIADAAEPEVKAEPEAEPKPEAEVPPEPAPAPDALPIEGERLDARMDDVLSELERRYRGRRVGSGDTPDEPDPASRPRRPRRRP